MKKIQYFFLLFLPVLGFAQSRYGVEGVPMCWTTALGVDSSIVRYVLISTTGQPVKTISYENAQGAVVNVSGGVLRYGFCDCAGALDSLIDGSVTWAKLATAVKDSINKSVTWARLSDPVKDSIRVGLNQKRDTFITVPHSTNYIPNVVITEASRFYENINLSCRGVTDTSVIAFLGVVSSDHYGVVYNVKNDSGLVEVRVFAENAHSSNGKIGYLLKRGQMAQVRALKDQVYGNGYRWAVSLVWDSIGGDSIPDASIGPQKLNFQVPSVTRVPNYNQNTTFDSKFLVYAAAIVRPSNTWVLNQPITWEFLTSGSGHDFIFFTSAVGLSTGSLSIKYPKVKRVVNVHVTPDESFSGQGITCGPTVGFDSMQIASSRYVIRGVRLQGNGSGGWTQSGSASLDITSYSTGSSFNYVDPGYSAAYDYNATSITYVGANNYRIRRVFSGLGAYNMRFILVDNTTNIDVATNPTTSDYVVVSGGGASPSAVALNSFNASNSTFATSFNFWVSGWFEAWMVASPISTTSILVRWQPNYPSATNYKIYRDTNANFSTQTLIHTGTSGQFTDTGLTTNNLYYYKLVATVGADVTVTTFATRTE